MRVYQLDGGSAAPAAPAPTPTGAGTGESEAAKAEGFDGQGGQSGGYAPPARRRRV